MSLYLINIKNDVIFLGFTSGNSTWLPISPNYWRDNMVDLSRTKSNLRTYRQLAKLRQIDTIIKGDLHLYLISQWVFGFSRYLIWVDKKKF